VYVCTTPSRKNRSLYEMVLGSVPDEAVEAFRELVQLYESETNGYMLSKSGLATQFLNGLDEMTGDEIDKYIVEKKGAARRPMMWEAIAKYKNLYFDLVNQKAVPNYLAAQFGVASPASSEAGSAGEAGSEKGGIDGRISDGTGSFDGSSDSDDSVASHISCSKRIVNVSNNNTSYKLGTPSSFNGDTGKKNPSKPDGQCFFTSIFKSARYIPDNVTRPGP
jgi:hypothetical protein